MEYLIGAVVLGVIPAAIASTKGRNFMLWWFYGAMLFIVALPMSIIIKSKEESSIAKRKCVKCAEEIQLEAVVCKHCGADVKPLSESEIKEIRKKQKESGYVPGWLILVVFVALGVFIWSKYSVEESVLEKSAVETSEIYHSEPSANEIMSDINDKVAEDAVAQYELAVKHGSEMDQCVQAGFVQAAYLQAHNEESYKAWTSIRAARCKIAGIEEN